jgi:hypothetical protein
LLVGDREDEAAELRVLGADPLFALGLAALELSTRRRSRCAALGEFPEGRPARWSQVVCNAPNRLRTPVVDRPRLDRKCEPADAAGAGEAQAQVLLGRFHFHWTTVR